MQIYFNWLGEWIELNNDEDLINGIDPISFITASIKLNESKDIMLYEEIITITKKDYYYSIPGNLLVWKEQKNIPNIEEKW